MRSAADFEAKSKLEARQLEECKDGMSGAVSSSGPENRKLRAVQDVFFLWQELFSLTFEDFKAHLRKLERRDCKSFRQKVEPNIRSFEVVKVWLGFEGSRWEEDICRLD